MSGTCVKGESCPYLHGDAQTQKVASFAPSQQYTLDIPKTNEETKTAHPAGGKPHVINVAAMNDPKVIKDLIVQQSKSQTQKQQKQVSGGAKQQQKQQALVQTPDKGLNKLPDFFLELDNNQEEKWKLIFFRKQMSGQNVNV